MLHVSLIGRKKETLHRSGAFRSDRTLTFVGYFVLKNALMLDPSAAVIVAR
jgi:hypothetical protein